MLATDVDLHYEKVVLHYQHQLYAFMLRQTGSHQDAEDILQETFLQSYHALKDYPVQRILTLQIRPWLYKITLNVYYSRLRKTKLQLVPFSSPQEAGLPEVEDSILNQPEVIVEGKERLRELERYITKLPGQYREVVNLFYYEQLSYQEIARLLNIPLGTVKSHLHRGIHHLRKALVSNSIVAS